MKHQKIVIAYLIVVLNLLCYNVFADQPEDNKPISKDTINTCLVEDDPVISMLDSMSISSYLYNFNFTSDTSKLNIYHFPYNFIPRYSDSVYFERIKKLNGTTPCNLFYNDEVKKYINVYAVNKRNLTSRVLGLAQLYFPIFESVMDKYNIPLEIKYLAIVESALNPIAVSPARAGGIWQFIPSTGRIYGLKSTPLVDDRFDIYKSTVAACRHMRDLYNMFHNWELVLAAYNAGAGSVNRAIIRSGGKMDFESIKRFLPKETRAYVPAFIAVNYVMNYAAEHNIYPTNPSIFNHELDTVTVKKPLTFEQISEMLKIPYEYISLLNPSFRKGIIPSENGTTYILRLPKDFIAAFINNEEALYAYKPVKPNKYEMLAKYNKKGSYTSKNGYHTVRSGETLSRIANKYNCSIAELKVWNRLKTIHIRPGQKLLVLNPKTETSYNN